MATQIQLRRGTATQHATFTGAASEITFDTSNTTVRVHDGSTAGGFKLATENRVTTLVNDRLQVANASATFVTKAVAVNSNNALILLINDRLQIANAAATYQTIANEQANLANTNAYIASVQSALDVQEAKQASDLANTNAYIASESSTSQATYVTKATAVSSNNALLNLINDRMQVANVSSLVSTEVTNLVDSAPETLNTLNELAAALGDDANFATTTAQTLGTKAANTYVNQTFETKAVALTSNTAQNVLINDRIQVANARVEFLQSSNTTITNDASSITTTQSNVDLNDQALVNPAGFITLNIGGTNYKLPFYS